MGARKETARDIKFREKDIPELARLLYPQIEAKRRAEFDELRRILNEDQFGYDWWRIRGSWICRRRDTPA